LTDSFSSSKTPCPLGDVISVHQAFFDYHMSHAPWPTLISTACAQFRYSHLILVLDGVHAATQCVAGLPQGGVEFGFIESHDKQPLFGFSELYKAPVQAPDGVECTIDSRQIVEQPYLKQPLLRRPSPELMGRSSDERIFSRRIPKGGDNMSLIFAILITQ